MSSEENLISNTSPETAALTAEDTAAEDTAAGDTAVKDTVVEDTAAEDTAAPVGSSHKTLRLLACILTALTAGIGVLTMLGIRYMFRIWAGGSVQELVYTMTGNLEGVSAGMVTDTLLNIALPAILVLTAYILVLRFFILKQKPVWLHIFNTVLLLAALIPAGLQVHSTWVQLDITDYLAEQGYIEIHNIKTLTRSACREYANYVIEQQMELADADARIQLELEQRRLSMSFIDANFVDPASVAITEPMKKRNLILIFLESMEMTYSDKTNGGAFDTNYIPNLTALSEQYENFSGTEQGLNGAEVLTYSTWTMGGIFAQTGGLPLNLPIGRNQMDTQEIFLPTVTALGDILQEYGYKQYFQCGSDVRFGGRKAYFKTHGDYTLYDLDSAWADGYVPYGRYVWWGYEDHYLFDEAKEHLLELGAQDEPFNYTMLTVDTHYPDGYPCSLCGNDLTFRTSGGYTTPYGNVIHCSDQQVSDFIAWIQEQDFYENTTIVLLGDHLTMDGNFCSDIDPNYMRKTYVTYINSAVEPELNTKREYVTEDSYPTILASLGFKIAGNKLGLGTNLFSSLPTLVEEYGYTDMDYGITQLSDTMAAITADVDVDSAAEKYNVYNANVTISDLDEASNTYTITVSDITSSTGVASVYMYVWPYGDDSDAKWVTTYKQEDGTYQGTISANIFDLPDGKLQVRAYCYDSSWYSRKLTEALTVELKGPGGQSTAAPQ